MSGAYERFIVEAVFTWVSSPKGLAAFFYVVAAREPDYRQKQNDFVRILQSFRIIGAPAGAGAQASSGIQYAKFTDPKEGAYSIEVPAGWKTEGGLFRFHSLDIRAATESVSPGGQMGVFLGDARYGPLVEPMPYFPEGSVYVPYGLKHLVRSFAHGAVICREFLLSKVAQVCPNLQIAEVKDLPDQVPKFIRDDQSLARVTWGDVSFRCGEQTQPKTGRCMAGTEQWKTSAPSMPRSWKVFFLGAYFAPPEKESLAESIYGHMLGSTQGNPRWQAMQSQRSGTAGQIISQGANEMSLLGPPAGRPFLLGADLTHHACPVDRPSQ